MIMNVELSESGGEVYRVTREEISMDTVQRVVNLTTVRSVNLECNNFYCWTRTKNVTFPSLKKYLWCRTNELSVVPSPGYMLPDGHVLVPLGSITWELTYLA